MMNNTRAAKSASEIVLTGEADVPVLAHALWERLAALETALPRGKAYDAKLECLASAIVQVEDELATALAAPSVKALNAAMETFGAVAAQMSLLESSLLASAA